MFSPTISEYIRRNILGLVAIFIALSGAAVATNVATNQTGDTEVAKVAEKERGLQGAPGPSSGAAGGESTGTNPDPTPKPPETWHEIGAVGEPAFQNSWAGVASNSTPAFYRDSFGVVHLKGPVEDGANNTTVFTLPRNSRPAETMNFAVVSHAPSLGIAKAQVTTGGDVRLFTGGSTAGGVSLGGVTFRACGAPGADSC